MKTNFKNSGMNKTAHINSSIVIEGTMIGRNNIQRIRLSNKVREIKPKAVSGCNELRRVFIPKTVEKIHKYAFYKCPKLQEVILQGNTIIEQDAFKYCDKNLRFIKGV